MPREINSKRIWVTVVYQPPSQDTIQIWKGRKESEITKPKGNEMSQFDQACGFFDSILYLLQFWK